MIRIRLVDFLFPQILHIDGHKFRMSRQKTVDLLLVFFGQNGTGDINQPTAGLGFNRPGLQYLALGFDDSFQKAFAEAKLSVRSPPPGSRSRTRSINDKTVKIPIAVRNQIRQFNVFTPKRCKRGLIASSLRTLTSWARICP